MKKRALAAIAAGAFVAASLAGAGAADAATKKPKVYKSCSALRKVYPNGMAKSGAKDKPKAGYKASKGWHTNGSIYAANKKLDTDRDKIACEKTGAKLPAKPVRLVIGKSTATFPGGVTVFAKFITSSRIQDTDVNGDGFGALYELTVRNGSKSAVYDPSDMNVGVTYGPSGLVGAQVFDSANHWNADGNTNAVPIAPGGTETLHYEFKVPMDQTTAVVMSMSANGGETVFFYAPPPTPAPVVPVNPAPVSGGVTGTVGPGIGTASGGLIGGSSGGTGLPGSK